MRGTVRKRKARWCVKACGHEPRLFYRPEQLVSQGWKSLFTYAALMEIRNNEWMELLIEQTGALFTFYAQAAFLYLYILFGCPVVFKWNFKRWVFFATIVVSVNVVKVIIKLRARQIAVYVIGLMKGSLSQIFKIMFLTVFTFDIETTTTSYQYRVTV